MIYYLLAYSSLITYCKRLKEKKGHICHYSFWIWGYLFIFLLSRKGRWFIFQKTWGLFLGTQVFWLYDRYDILHQIGKTYTTKAEKYGINTKLRKNLLIYLGDLFVHGFPLLITYLAIKNDDKKMIVPTGSGSLVFALHLLYAYILTGGYNIADMYEIKTTKDRMIAGWLIFFLSYTSGEYISHMIH